MAWHIPKYIGTFIKAAHESGREVNQEDQHPSPRGMLVTFVECVLYCIVVAFIDVCGSLLGRCRRI